MPFPGKFIYQYSDAQGVSSDAALLQETAIKRFPVDQLDVLELGAGCGIISIMLALQKPTWQITGLEIQESLVELSRENAQLCGVDISFHHQDLREYQEDGYDLIVANPPWMPLGSGLPSPNAMRRISRQEETCTMRDVMQTLQRCLKPGGNALLLYPISRIEDVRIEALQSSLDIIAELSFPESPKIMIFHLSQRG